MTLRITAASFAVALVAAGCGGSEFTAAVADASADGTVVTTSADQACGDNAHARCTRLQACSPSDIATTYIDEGTCETRLKLNCLNSLSAPDTGNTPEATEACAVAYTSESCDDLLDDHPPAACLQALGTRATGRACGTPGQCQTGFCAIVPGSECGTCGPVPQAGESCTQLTTCGQLLTCFSTTSLCTGFAAQGGVCNKGQPCGAGLYCVGSTTTTNGTCQQAVELANAACDPQAKTSAGCDRSALLTCNSATKECAAIQLAAAGQACGTVGGQLALCAAAGTCTAGDAGAGDGSTVSSIESCLAPAREGDACDLVRGPFCITPARCISPDGGTTGTCQFPDPSQCP